MPSYRLRALVLRKTKLGEADNIVTMLASDGRQVRAVAKGVRKTRSKFGARLEPFSVVDLLLASGRTLEIVQEVQTVASHEALRTDYDRTAHAFAVVELLDRASLEGQGEPLVFEMSLAALDALEEATGGATDAPGGPTEAPDAPRSPAEAPGGPTDAPGGPTDAPDAPRSPTEAPDAPRSPTEALLPITAAFVVKAMGMLGYRPQLSACVECAACVEVTGFSLDAGGVLCAECGDVATGVFPLRQGVPEALAAMLGSRFQDIPGLGIPGPLVRECAVLLKAFAERQLNTKLKALGALLVGEGA